MSFLLRACRGGLFPILTTALLAAAILAGSLRAQEAKGEPTWRLAIQAWTFNKLTFVETVDKVAQLGVKYIEAYPGQKISPDSKGKMGPSMTEEDIKLVKDKLAAAGVTLVNYGVTALDKKEAKSREVFEWAKKMGVETIVSEPAEDALPTVDKLCQEYNIRVAIHNHPKPSHYWNPDTVLAALKDRSKMIGSCSDTGHWVRSGLNPLECLKKLEGHIVSLHFKDLKDKHDVPWGTGASNAKALLAELKRQGFSGVFSMEYEAKFTMEDLAACVKFFNENK